MSTTTTKIKGSQETLMDDISEKNEEQAVDQDKLAALKAKMNKKNEETVVTVQEKKIEKKRSFTIGVIGSGAAGSNLAQTFYKRGYNAICFNTAEQDLAHIELPEQNKLLLKFGLNGTAKTQSIGREAAEHYKEEISDLINKRLGDCQVILFAFSLGGGSGGGSSSVIVDLLTQFEKPVVVMTILPLSTDDPITKNNAITTLASLTKLVNAKKIDNLIVVDNARIETIYKDVNPMQFFEISNEAIVDPIDQFNSLSMLPSAVKALDSGEFGKLLVESGGLSVYGLVKCPDFTRSEAIAECIVENISGNLLASGFNLNTARYAGYILCASEAVWKQIPNASLTYAQAVLAETTAAAGIFRGIYTIESNENCVFIYSFYNGLSLPAERINSLKAQAQAKMEQSEQKNSERAAGIKLEVEEQTISATQEIKNRIESKKSGFGKLHSGALIDRRK
jgi:cell division GTPase FtsZ